MSLVNIFKNNVRYYRYLKNLSQEQLAEKVGLSTHYISDIERGRYEAGVPANQTAIDGTAKETSNVAGNPVSKKGATVWTWIDYTNANNNARAYKNNNEVASGLLTGTQWDTVCKWLQNSGYSVIDSRNWGNHSDSQSPANIEGYGKKQITGFSEKWKANNIYDFAGNTWSWVNEMYAANLVCRGGRHGRGGSELPASSRTHCR